MDGGQSSVRFGFDSMTQSTCHWANYLTAGQTKRHNVDVYMYKYILYMYVQLYTAYSGGRSVNATGDSFIFLCLYSVRVGKLIYAQKLPTAVRERVRERESVLCHFVSSFTAALPLSLWPCCLAALPLSSRRSDEFSALQPVKNCCASSLGIFFSPCERFAFGRVSRVSLASLAASAASIYCHKLVSTGRIRNAKQRNAAQHAYAPCAAQANRIAQQQQQQQETAATITSLIDDRFSHFPIASAATVARSVPFRSVFSRAARLPSVFRLLSVGCRLSSVGWRLSPSLVVCRCHFHSLAHALPAVSAAFGTEKRKNVSRHGIFFFGILLCYFYRVCVWVCACVWVCKHGQTQKNSHFLTICPSFSLSMYVEQHCVSVCVHVCECVENFDEL